MPMVNQEGSSKHFQLESVAFFFPQGGGFGKRLLYKALIHVKTII